MSLEVNNGNAGVIGRMFARQNVQGLYGKQKTAVDAVDEKNPAAVDRVDLSPFAPKPLAASMVELAAETAQKLNTTGRLTSDETEALREDRVYAAIATLIASGVNSRAGSTLKGWPGGIPAPTSAEIEAAYRRLSQRLDRVEDAENPDSAQRTRTSVLEKARNINFGELAARMYSMVPAMSGA